MTVGRRVFRNYYKGHMDKTKGAWNQWREVRMSGVGGEEGNKGIKLYLNNNKIKKINKKLPKYIFIP